MKSIITHLQFQRLSESMTGLRRKPVVFRANPRYGGIWGLQTLTQSLLLDNGLWSYCMRNWTQNERIVPSVSFPHVQKLEGTVPVRAVKYCVPGSVSVLR